MDPTNSSTAARISLGEMYTKIMKSIADTINSPYSDPAQTILLAGILLVILCFLGIAGYLIYTAIMDHKKPKLPKVVLKREPRAAKERLISMTVMTVLVGAAVIYGFNYLDQPGICTSCHQDKQATESVATKHKGMSCIRCHEGSGITGYVAGKFDYARWAMAYLSGAGAQPQQAQISNDACLSCHRNIPKKTVKRFNIRVSHKEFLAIGESCTSCHASAPHALVNKTDRMSMNKCINCHNSQKASASCTLCHPNQADTNIRTASRGFLRIDVQPLTNCRGCHPPAMWKGECIQCHGLEMPHPPGWKEGSHAKLAFTNRALCDKCHPQPAGMQPAEFPHQGVDGVAKSYFCNKCHEFPAPHGPTQQWIRQHGPAAYAQIPVQTKVCIQCHGDGDPVRNCTNCHGDFCNKCHSDSRHATVSPLFGQGGSIEPSQSDFSRGP